MGFERGKPTASPPPARRKPATRTVQVRAHTRQVPVKRPAVSLRPVTQPLAPLQGAQRKAGQRVVAAVRPTERHVVIPKIGKLAPDASDAQRVLHASRVDRAARKYNLRTRAQIDALPPVMRKRVNRALGYETTVSRDKNIQSAMSVKSDVLPKGYSRDEAGMVFDSKGLPVPESQMPRIRQVRGIPAAPPRTLVDAARELAPEPQLTARQIAALGRAVVASNASQGRKAPASAKGGGSGPFGLIPATVTEHLAGNPLAAFVHGTAKIGEAAQQAIDADKTLRRTLPGRAIAGALSIPVNAIPTAADVVSAGFDAAAGNTKPLATLAKGFASTYEHPIRSFKQNPTGTVLAFAPVVGGVGRLAGAGMRSGALGEAATRAASTDRAPLRIFDEDAGNGGTETNKLEVVQRPYSKNVLSKGVRVAGERVAAKVTGSPRDVASTAQIKAALYGGSRIGHSLVEKGMLSKHAVGVSSPGLVDIFAGDHEVLRRSVAQGHTGTMHAILDHVDKTYGKGAADVVPLVAEGVVRRADTFVPDLQKELGRLKAAEKRGSRSTRPLHPGTPLEGKELEQNLKNQADIERLLKNHKLTDDPRIAVAAGDAFAQHSHEQGEALGELGGMRPEQQRAALFPAALAHEDAVTPVEAAARHADAKELVGVLSSRVKKLTDEGADPAVIKDTRKQLAEAQAARVQWGPIHPEAVRDVKAAGAVVKAARSSAKDAADAQRKAEDRVKTIVGKQRSRRGARLSSGKPAAATGAEVNELVAARAQAGRAAAESRLAQHHLSVAKNNQDAVRSVAEKRVVTGLRKPSGEPFTTPELEAAFTKHTGRAHPGFLSHELPEEWKGSVFSRTGGRPGIEQARRSGESFQKGAYKRDAEALLHQVYRTSNQVMGHVRSNALAERFGVGRFPSVDDAQTALERFNGTPTAKGLSWSVHQIGPDQTLDAASAGVRSTEPISGAEPHDFAETNQDSPKYTLLPDVVANRLGQHDKIALAGPNVGKILTNKWRNAQLFTSPRWVLGTPQENAIRLAFAGVSPFALAGHGSAFKIGGIISDQWQKAADDTSLPAAQRTSAASNLSNWTSGTHYGSVMATAVKDEELPWAKSNVAAKVVVGSWEKWRDGLGKRMKNMEANAKQAALGRQAIKEMGTFGRNWTKVTARQDKVIRDWAMGKTDPNEAVRLTQDIFRMAGNWTHLTPAVKAAVQSYTPFGLWWKNSLGFVFKVVPQDHPIKLAILAAAVAGDPKNKARDQEQGYLGGSFHVNVPVLGGVNVQPTYYSPMGVAAEPFSTMSQMVAPQAMDTLLTAKGIDSLDDEKLTMPTADGGKRGLTPVETAEAIMGQLGSGYIPGARQASQLIEQGATPYPTASLATDLASKLGLIGPQTKPGTKRGIVKTLIKVLSPAKFYFDPRSGSGSAAALPLQRVDPGSPQAILAGSRGHVAVNPGLSDAQAILAHSRGH